MLVKTLKKLSADRHRSAGSLLEPGLDAAGIDRMLEDARARHAPVRGGPAQGWALSAPVEWLDAGAIRAHAGGLPLRLELADETSSTQDDIGEAVRRHGCGRMLAVCAEHQAGGRGRQGRPWESVPGCDVLMSVAFGFGAGIGACMGISLAMAVAVRDAVPQVRLKWPNDIVTAGGEKLGGILVDLAAGPGGPAVKVGVGINHRRPPGCARRFATLDGIGAGGAGRNALAGSLIRRIGDRARQFEREGLSRIGDEWRAGALLRRGEEIGFHDGAGQARRAAYHDIGARGELVVSTPGGLETFHSAEIHEAGAVR